MDAEEFVGCADLRYVEDVLTRDEALAIVERNIATRDRRIRHLEKHGYPAYTMSAGWLGYDDAKIRRLSREAVDQGFRHIKLKVGANVDDDVRRLRSIRESASAGVGISGFRRRTTLRSTPRAKKKASAE